MATVGRGAEQYTVRFPEGLRDRIKAAAEANNRSMNAEIVATLEKEYPEPLSPMEVLERLDELIKNYQPIPMDQTLPDGVTGKTILMDLRRQLEAQIHTDAPSPEKD